jgi:hypothetical protein
MTRRILKQLSQLGRRNPKLTDLSGAESVEKVLTVTFQVQPSTKNSKILFREKKYNVYLCLDFFSQADSRPSEDP